MGFKDKVKGMMSQHGDKADRGVEKAGDAVDERTGGKHRRHIDTGTDKARKTRKRMTRDEGEGGTGGPAA
ncbi:antitoxin [Streptomyces sp. TRM43335]|uniref:Antitoxin n=1 Tax=Streptomyces taklimakanensis TaxID=2569853 RepID=A0A6G2BGC1_9ACTN|nr:antitoxin [Streptomyces taklimakanensis]MTE21325.1 antitoxin [Streptomyces taklimakanensis]